MGGGQVLRLIDLLDLPGRAPGAESHVTGVGAMNSSSKTALRPHELMLQLSKVRKIDAGRYWGQGIEEYACTRHSSALRPVCIPPPPCTSLQQKRVQAPSRRGEGEIPYLHLGGGLDELRDGDLVLLEPPLD